MSRTVRGLCAWMLLALAGPLAAIDTTPPFEDPVLEARYERLIRELRCLQCQNNSIADSPGGLAADLRAAVREQLAQDRSDPEILEFMTSRYGDFVLYRPPFTPRTWLLWLAPALLVAGGGWIAYRVIARRAALVQAGEGDQAGESDEEEFDDEDGDHSHPARGDMGDMPARRSGAFPGDADEAGGAREDAESVQRR